MTAAPNAPERTLEYAGRIPSHRFHFYYVVYTILTLVPILLLLIGLLVVTPQFKETFRDFKTTLPFITEIFLRFSEFMRSGFWAVLVVAAVFFPLLPARITSSQSAVVL